MTAAASPGLAPLLHVLLAYLLGSVIGSLLIGRLAGGIDIRAVGSGNAGGTNALRTQGRLFALGVVIIDVAKGWIAARWLPTLTLPGFANGTPAATGSPSAPPGWLPDACGFAAVVGHVWPAWYGFRGGKGAATLLGALAGLAPRLLLPVIAAWFVVVASAGFVGLATVVAAAVLPCAVALRSMDSARPLLAFAVAAALLVLFTHRSNLRRMRAGIEPQAGRLWLLGRLRQRPD